MKCLRLSDSAGLRLKLFLLTFCFLNRRQLLEIWLVLRCLLSSFVPSGSVPIQLAWMYFAITMLSILHQFYFKILRDQRSRIAKLSKLKEKTFHAVVLISAPFVLVYLASNVISDSTSRLFGVWTEYSTYKRIRRFTPSRNIRALERKISQAFHYLWKICASSSPIAL